MKLMKEYINELRRVRVLWDAEWEEYQCKLYQGTTLVAGATYHTNDKRDAYDTATVMVRGE